MPGTVSVPGGTNAILSGTLVDFDWYYLREGERRRGRNLIPLHAGLCRFPAYSVACGRFLLPDCRRVFSEGGRKKKREKPDSPTRWFLPVPPRIPSPACHGLS
ncbi:hypothetical protein BHE74_00056891 [Ensete ventricosum]|nr:hypothetical protein BHE74_00056891 [Ensete ventricosum]